MESQHRGVNYKDSNDYRMHIMLIESTGIRPPDVEAAMLVEVQKTNRTYRDPQGFLISQIQEKYAKTPKVRASK